MDLAAVITGNAISVISLRFAFFFGLYVPRYLSEASPVNAILVPSNEKELAVVTTTCVQFWREMGVMFLPETLFHSSEHIKYFSYF